MPYDNETYWTSLHKQFPGSLRAVGHPSLSEALNWLKYQSEAAALLTQIRSIDYAFRQGGQKSISILDLGAGIGHWSNWLWEMFRQRGYEVSSTALDISEEALSVLHERNPYIETIRADLTIINPDSFHQRYNLVMSVYCLHHLVNLKGFLNGLQSAARSVAPGGYLILMDPILTMPFSQFDVIDFPTYQGNGIVRHWHIIQDILAEEGLRVQSIQPAISFLLNGNIEAPNRAVYALTGWLWRNLCAHFYRSERGVNRCARLLSCLDEALKRRRWGFSSSICVFSR